MRGVTCRQKAQIAFKLFQPALPMRGVTDVRFRPSEIEQFQPALPMRGVTQLVRGDIVLFIDFNPHSPCGE